MVVNTGVKADLPVLTEYIRPHRDDRYFSIARQQPDRLSRVNTVHFRHLYIHHDELVAVGTRLLNRDLAVLCKLQNEPRIKQLMMRQHPVDFIILSDQNPGAGMVSPEYGFSRFASRFN